MGIPYEVLMLILTSMLLIWAAIADLRTRRIPRIASYLILLLAIAWLFAHEQWWEAVFLGLVVIRPAKKPLLYLAELSGFLLMVMRSFSLETIFFVVAILVVQLLFDNRILGGGDAQVATAVIAIIPEWRLFVLLTLVYVAIVIILSVKRFGFRGWMARLKQLLSRHRKPIETDTEKIQTPWVVIVAACTLIYIWVYPGLLSALVGIH